ncbi:RNA polymerase sigma factor [Steroidobacter flavus]|uniref:RNA polymerase sigma factor n=1 Tax=Steroidobacter flavus TaxID=1842136 RepID=A0ABV8T4Z1_9GAMM
MTDGGEGESKGLGRIAAAIRSHRSDLIGFLARRLRCFATAEDVAQEACTRLFEARDAVHSPRAFLFQVAANLALDHRRVHRRRDDLLREVHDILWTEDDQVTPERHIVARDLIERLEAAIADLPETSRHMFRLSYYEGLTQNEIAEQLQVSRTTVKKHVRRVFLRLAEVQSQWAEQDQRIDSVEAARNLLLMADGR